MASTLIIPLDIQESIIDLLAEDNPHLKTCSLVCRAFLPLCRKHIFGSITLNNGLTKHQFQGLLCTSPELAHYIRNLDYHITTDDFDSASIQECLKRISRLKFLSVGYIPWVKFDWSSNPLRPALLHLLHLRTLTHFTLIGGFKNFITSDLIPCINLKNLRIDEGVTVAATNSFSKTTLPDRSIQLNEFIVGNEIDVLNICTAQRTDGQPIVDFSSLSKIKIVLQEGYVKFPLELFKRCKRLTHASISFFDPEKFCPSISKLLRPSMETLTHIDITIPVSGIWVDPLTGIPSELEVMHTKNIIETIFINVWVPLDCRQGDDWGRLDQVLTGPGWHALRQVSLTITLGNEANIEKRDLQRLRKTQFSQLSVSKSVEFKFEVL